MCHASSLNRRPEAMRAASIIGRPSNEVTIGVH